jgi:alkylated DNA repair dioxygenase AlkB
METYDFEETDGSTSSIIYIPNAFDKELCNKYMNLLNDIDYWKQGIAFGKKIARKQLWFDKENKTFSTKWKNFDKYDRWISEKYEDWFYILEDQVKSIIKSKLNVNINNRSLLFNKYEDGNYFIPRHQDRSNDENEFILSISFGDSRRFLMQRVKYNEENPKSIKLDKENSYKNLEFLLSSGDIIIMKGSCQKWWSHSIPKEDTVIKSVRYNITLRNIKSFEQNKSGF